MSSESSSTGAMTASSTSRSPGWSLRMSISSRTSMGCPVCWRAFGRRSEVVAEPFLGLVEQEQADDLAALEVAGDAVVVVEVHIAEVDARAGHEGERALRGVGDAGERVDGRHLDGKFHASDAG